MPGGAAVATAADCAVRAGSGPSVTHLAWRGRPMSMLVQSLEAQTGRLVIDRTGLAGMYDVELDVAHPWGSADAAAGGASIFAAVDDQLGLKLESTDLDADMLDIVSISRPTPN